MNIMTFAVAQFRFLKILAASTIGSNPETTPDD